MHTYAQTYARMHIHVRTPHKCARAHCMLEMHTCAGARAHVCMHTRVHARTRTCMRTGTGMVTFARTHARAQVHMHACEDRIRTHAKHGAARHTSLRCRRRAPVRALHLLPNPAATQPPRRENKKKPWPISCSIVSIQSSTSIIRTCTHASDCAHVVYTCVCVCVRVCMALPVC